MELILVVKITTVLVGVIPAMVTPVEKNAQLKDLTLSRFERRFSTINSEFEELAKHSPATDGCNLYGQILAQRA